MKKLFTNLKVFMTLLLLCGVSNVWAAEGDTHSFTDDVAFNQLLNNNASISDVKITSPSYPVKEVVLNCKYNKTAGGVTISITIGGETFGTAQTFNENATKDIKFTGDAKYGDIVIKFENNCGSGTGKGTFYLNSVTLTEGATDPSKTLESIAISGTPTKTIYNEGESFDPAGLTVIGTYGDKSTKEITDGITWSFNPEILIVGTTSISVTATVLGKTSEAYLVNGLIVKVSTSKTLSFNFKTHPTGWPTGKTNAAAGNYTYNLNGTDYSFSMTKNGDGIYLAGTSPSSGYLLIASGNKFGLPAIQGYKLTKVVGQLNDNGNPSTASVVAVVDDNETVSGGTGQTWSTMGAEYTYNLTGTEQNTSYYLSVSNKNCQMINLTLTYEKVPQTKNVTISEVGYATACLPFNAMITSENATAYYVTGTSGTALTKVEAEVIPAGKGVLLKSDNGREATVTFTESTETADAATDNMMIGSLTGETFSGGATYYILSTGENGIGFYWDASTNDEGASAYCAAGKAVLAVPASAGIKSFFSLDDETTSIQSLTPALSEGERIYNLNGQVVGKDYKGIVIVNGKKMLNK